MGRRGGAEARHQAGSSRGERECGRYDVGGGRGCGREYGKNLKCGPLFALVWLWLCHATHGRFGLGEIRQVFVHRHHLPPTILPAHHVPLLLYGASCSIHTLLFQPSSCFPLLILPSTGLFQNRFGSPLSSLAPPTAGVLQPSVSTFHAGRGSDPV